MAEEELSLGEDEELTVGEPTGELSLDSGTPEVLEAEEHDLKSDDLSVRLSLTAVEALLLEGKLPKEKIADYTRRNLDLYRPFGLRRFQDPDNADLERIHSWEAQWRQEADIKWGKTEPERLDNFSSALNQALRLFAEGSNLKQGLRELAFGNLAATVRGKLGDGKLDPFELKELMESARDAGLWFDEETKKETILRIEKVVHEERGRIVDFQAEFLERLKVRKPLERIDTDAVRAAVYDEFRELREAHHFTYGIKDKASAKEVLQEMHQAMSSAGLEFLPKESLFEDLYLEGYLRRKGLSTAVPFSTDDYYQIKNSAIGQFGFDETEWTKYAERKGIQKKPEVTAKFNFGKDQAGNRLEAETFDQIAQLLRRNREKAILKLYDGELENYLQDCGNLDLERKVHDILAEYRDDQQAGLTKTIFTLLPDEPIQVEGHGACRSPDEVALGLESAQAMFMNSLVGVPNHEVQLWLEARSQQELAAEFRALSLESGISKKKRLNGLIWLLEKKAFRRQGAVYYSPNEIVALPTGKSKDALAAELADEDSKFSFWMERRFSELEGNVAKWRGLKRANGVTLTYALEKSAPFHFPDETVDTHLEAQDYVYRHALTAAFVRSLVTQTALREELNFWLLNYKKTDLDALLMAYLKQTQKDPSHRTPFTEVIASLSAAKLSTTPLVQYWRDFVPLFESARSAGTVTEDEYKAHKGRLLKELSSKPSPEVDLVVEKYLQASLESQSPDDELIYSLFRYYRRPTVDREFYVHHIQPLLLSAVEKGRLPPEASGEQEEFFILKYIQDLPRLKLDEQINTLEAIRALRPQHPMVALYDQSRFSAENVVRLTNRKVVGQNSLRRDLVLLVCLLVAVAGVAAANLSHWLTWTPWQPPAELVGTITFWGLIVGLFGLLLVLKKRRR